MIPKSKRLAASDTFYLFLVCLYENFFLVLPVELAYI